MSAIKWYKRDPNAALGGMMVLTLEERGAYNTILDLIYANDGNLMDDDRFICGWLRCDLRVWKRLKNRLVDLGKIELKGGLVTNFRATSEVDEALGTIASVSELNRIKGIKSGIARRKNNNLNEPTVEPKSNTPTPTPTPTPILASSIDPDSFDKLDAALRKIEGVENHPIFADPVIAPIWQIAQQGYDLKTQITPSIKRQLQNTNGKRISRWSYFIPGIIEDAKASMSAGANPALSVPPEKWVERIEWARKNKQWGGVWGAMPGQPGCGAPSNLLKPTDGKDWTEWKASA